MVDKMKTAAVLHDDPIAASSSGMLIANATHLFHGAGNPYFLLKQAIATGRPVFVGIVLDGAEIEDTLQWIDDSAAEIVATLVQPNS